MPLTETPQQAWASVGPGEGTDTWPTGHGESGPPQDEPAGTSGRQLAVLETGSGEHAGGGRGRRGAEGRRRRGNPQKRGRRGGAESAGDGSESRDRAEHGTDRGAGRRPEMRDIQDMLKKLEAGFELQDRIMGQREMEREESLQDMKNILSTVLHKLGLEDIGAAAESDAQEHDNITSASNQAEGSGGSCCSVHGAGGMTNHEEEQETNIAGQEAPRRDAVPDDSVDRPDSCTIQTSGRMIDPVCTPNRAAHQAAEKRAEELDTELLNMKVPEPPFQRLKKRMSMRVHSSKTPGEAASDQSQWEEYGARGGALVSSHAHQIESERRRELLKSMNKELLMNWGNDEHLCTRIMKALLSGETRTLDMVDFLYDRRKLEGETARALYVSKIANEQQLRAEKEVRKSQTRAGNASQDKKQQEEAEAKRKASLLQKALQRKGSILHESERSVQGLIMRDTPEEQHRLLGIGLSKADFLDMINGMERQDANQLVFGRLMQEVAELAEDLEHGRTGLECLNCYKCIHPEGTFMWVWTIAYICLILYIATYDLVSQTLLSTTGCGATAKDYFDIAVDAFFVVDVFFRCFVFGQMVERPGFFSEVSEVILDPDKVLLRYARTGMAIDVITAIPFAWIVTFAFGRCGEGQDVATFRLIRIFRGTRITRVLRLFQQPQIRKAIRKIKHQIGHNNVIKFTFLLFAILLLNHIWTCLAWLVQSVDIEDNGQGVTGFEEYQISLGLNPDNHIAEDNVFSTYSIVFMITLQNVFAIEPFVGDTPVEAWFGVLTLLLSVCTQGIVLSQIIEIWESHHKTQTEMDDRINRVVSFLRTNNIDGDVRNDVLDYFEFRFSNTSDQENDTRILSLMPTELQSRIIHRIFPSALDSAYIFSTCSEGCVSQLIFKMSQNQLRTMPNQVITSQGSLERRMYLLKNGIVDVHIKDSQGRNHTAVSMRNGQCFGELSLWMECRRTATVTSRGFCQLFMLSHQDLLEVIAMFPSLETTMSTFAISAALRVEDMNPGLKGIPIKTAERLAKRMSERECHFKDGELLCQEGQPAECAFLLRTGKVTVEILQGRLDILSDPRCVGFTPLFCDKPYQEQMRANGVVHACKLTRQDCFEVFENDQETYKLLRISAMQDFKSIQKDKAAFRWAVLVDELTSRDKDSSLPKSLSAALLSDDMDARSSRKSLVANSGWGFLANTESVRSIDPSSGIRREAAAGMELISGHTARSDMLRS